MPLHDEITKQILEGHLEEQWTTGDLLANASLLREFSVHNLRSQPANRSVSLPGLNLGTGANAGSGADAPYLRVGMRGKAFLYSVRDPAAGQDTMVPACAGENLQRPMCDDTAVEPIVEPDTAVVDGAGIVSTYVPDSEARTALMLLIGEMQEEEPWDERLRNYIWKGRTFEETQLDLADITWRGSMLSRLVRHDIPWTRRDEVQAVAWAMEIFRWGGTRQKSPVTWQKVRGTLANAVLNRMEFPDAPMNSGYTKVATFGTAYLEEEATGMPQVINDSRVATSLTCRLDRILREHGWDPADLFPGLGRIEAARGGTRPRPLSTEWPDAYRKWSGQFAATSAVLAIRDILNGDSRFPAMPSGEREIPWTMRGVEAVLFMDGY